MVIVCPVQLFGKHSNRHFVIASARSLDLSSNVPNPGLGIVGTHVGT
jgi:hypothetical protein